METGLPPHSRLLAVQAEAAGAPRGTALQRNSHIFPAQAPREAPGSVWVAQPGLSAPWPGGCFSCQHGEGSGRHREAWNSLPHLYSPRARTPTPQQVPPFLRDSWLDTQNGCPSPSPTHSAGSVWVLLESACSELLLPGPADSPAFVIDRVFQNLPAWKLARLALLPLLPPRVPAPEFLGRQFLLWTHGFLAHSWGRPAEELMVNACLVLLPPQNCALS